MKRKYKIGLWALGIIAGVFVLSALLLVGGITILMISDSKLLNDIAIVLCDILTAVLIKFA